MAHAPNGKITRKELTACAYCRHEVNHKHLGSRLRAKREESGVAQNEIAERLGVSATFVCDLENGNRNWTADLVNRYLAACKLKP